MLKIKNIITEMKSTFDEVLNRLNLLRKESLSLKDTSLEICKTEKVRKTKTEKKNKISRTCGTPA